MGHAKILDQPKKWSTNKSLTHAKKSDIHGPTKKYF